MLSNILVMSDFSKQRELGIKMNHLKVVLSNKKEKKK